MKDKLLQQEIWKDIPNYVGLYQASNLGNIRSLDKFSLTNNRFNKMKRKVKGRILKPHLNKRTGYLQVILSNDKNKKIWLVHRLIALTFIPNLENKEQVNHIDGNKHNNNVENLEWVTCSENMKHAFKTNLNHSNFKVQSGINHHFYGKHHSNEAKEKSRINHCKKIIQYDKNYNLIKIWKSIQEVEKNLNINNGNISECCRGKRKSAGGYIWRYANEG